MFRPQYPRSVFQRSHVTVPSAVPQEPQPAHDWDFRSASNHRYAVATAPACCLLGKGMADPFGIPRCFNWCVWRIDKSKSLISYAIRNEYNKMRFSNYWSLIVMIWSGYKSLCKTFYSESLFLVEQITGKQLLPESSWFTVPVEKSRNNQSRNQIPKPAAKTKNRHGHKYHNMVLYGYTSNNSSNVCGANQTNPPSTSRLSSNKS